METTSGKWRYALAGVAVAIGLAAVSAAVALWHLHELEQRQSRFVDRYWDAYLSDYYFLNGSWETAASRLEEALTSLERAVGGRMGLAVWDADGGTVFAGGTAVDAAASEMRPVLAEGRIVGYFRAEYDANMGVPAWFWTALLLAAAAGGAGWLALSMRMYRHGIRPLLGISSRLDQMLTRGGRVDEMAEPAQTAAARTSAFSSSREQPASIRSRELRISADLEHPARGIERSVAVKERERGTETALLLSDISDKLARLEERLDLLERVRKTMVADIAHELRTPLAVVRAKLENALFRQEAIPPEQIVILHEEVYRVSKLIRDLNSLVLAESGRLPLERSWFSLKQLMEQLAETMLPEAEEAGVSVTMSGFDSPCHIYADRERLQQVFVNLLGNALRYARSRIEVACSQDDTRIHIVVKDDGIGIEEEDLPYVFDRFYRSSRASGAAAARSSESDGGGRTSGLGLGLAIVKEFVNAHGGSVSVESKWNEGSAFQVTLPVFRE
jgi:Signal transduction histidine kinase